MLNKKVIVVSGFSRGGTNILWNIMQSHPQICSAIHETGTIFRKKEPLQFSRFISLLNKTGLINLSVSRRIIDLRLHRIKMNNYKHSENKYVYEGQTYSRKQVSESAICFKSVDFDIDHTPLLLKLYPNLYFIALTRNGYAVFNGHMRRGEAPEKAARLYREIAEKIKIYSETLSNFKLIRFEDVLQSPFKIAEELFTFTDVFPVQLGKLRLKSKKIISEKGEHATLWGRENQKYWMGQDEIDQFLDPNVNKRQIAQLSLEMIDFFNREAGTALDFFGYERA